MTPIDKIMAVDAAKCVDLRIADLPDRAKFRAASALRSLTWANEIYKSGLSIPASYFALHATEEAVAAFVSCAKVCGYGADAKNINLKNHEDKAVVSFLAQKVANLLEQFEIAVAVHPKTNKIAVRYLQDGNVAYAEASTDLLNFVNHEGEPLGHFYNEIQEQMGDAEAIKRQIGRIVEGRNEIIYATSKGFPTGFVDPEEALRRECKLTIGLVWACVDMLDHRKAPIPFIQQALRTANLVIDDMRVKKAKATTENEKTPPVS